MKSSSLCPRDRRKEAQPARAQGVKKLSRFLLGPSSVVGAPVNAELAVRSHARQTVSSVENLHPHAEERRAKEHAAREQEETGWRRVRPTFSLFLFLSRSASVSVAPALIRIRGTAARRMITPYGFESETHRKKFATSFRRVTQRTTRNFFGSCSLGSPDIIRFGPTFRNKYPGYARSHA